MRGLDTPTGQQLSAALVALPDAVARDEALGAHQYRVERALLAALALVDRAEDDPPTDDTVLAAWQAVTTLQAAAGGVRARTTHRITRTAVLVGASVVAHAAELRRWQVLATRPRPGDTLATATIRAVRARSPQSRG